MNKLVELGMKALVKKIKQDISKNNTKKLSKNRMKEFELTCKVTELPNKNWALDYYKAHISE